MTAAEELTKLTTAYSAWLDAGCPASISVNGRMLTSTAMGEYAKRIDILRAATARSSAGAFSVVQFRKQE